jgi:hypothetical protein
LKPANVNLIETLFIEIGNAAGDYTHCLNYSHDGEVEEIYALRDFVKVVRVYEENHSFVCYVCEEVDMCISGNIMSEEYEEGPQTSFDVEDMWAYPSYTPDLLPILDPL